MDYNYRDPREKKDASSESSESISDSKMDGAEKNMEQLNIEESQSRETTKGVFLELTSLKHASQKDPSTSKCEPIAGPSDLQNLHMGISAEIEDPHTKDTSFTDPNKEKNEEAKNTDIETEMQKSPIAANAPIALIKLTSSPTPETSKPRVDADKPQLHLSTNFELIISEGSPESSVSNPLYNSDSANTLSDISEIQSEIADRSASGGVCLDAKENLSKEQSPSSKPEFQRTSSEASEANISEIEEDPSANPSHSGSSNITNPDPPFEDSSSPKKKSNDRVPKRRTRSDSENGIPKKVGLGNQQQSASDLTEYSGSEKETAL